jgi:hypothetical protein
MQLLTVLFAARACLSNLVMLAQAGLVSPLWLSAHYPLFLRHIFWNSVR